MSFKTKLFLIPIAVTLVMSLTIGVAWWGAGSLEPYMIRIWLSVVIFSLNMPFLIYNGLKLGWKFFAGLVLLLLIVDRIQDYFTGEPGLRPEEMGRRWLWFIPVYVVLNLVVYTIAWYKGSSKQQEKTGNV